MKKINLGFVVNNLVVGGASKVLINLCNQLDPRLYNVHLIILSSDLQMEKILPLNSNVKKYIIDYSFVSSYSLLSYLKAAYYSSSTKVRAQKLLDVIQGLQLDILHFHTLPRQLIIGHLVQKDDPNIKLVYTDHGVRISKDDGYKIHQKLLLIKAYRKFYRNYHLIAVSKAVKEFITQSSLNTKGYSFNLLENSIPIHDYRRTNNIADLKQQFIYISRMNDQKGHDTLIQAWKNIVDPQKGTLLLVGPDEMNKRFHEMAREDKSIVFTGSVPDVKVYLKDSTVGIFPSQKEGLPIALLEKMAFDLPLIVSDIPELTSIIENNKEGLHFELDNVKDLQSKIEYAINHPKQMEAMGKQSRLKVESICKANDPLEFHNRFYDSLMQV